MIIILIIIIMMMIIIITIMMMIIITITIIKNQVPQQHLETDLSSPVSLNSSAMSDKKHCQKLNTK